LAHVIAGKSIVQRATELPLLHVDARKMAVRYELSMACVHEISRRLQSPDIPVADASYLEACCLAVSLCSGSVESGMDVAMRCSFQGPEIRRYVSKLWCVPALLISVTAVSC
jgi:hypothetical protein